MVSCEKSILLTLHLVRGTKVHVLPPNGDRLMPRTDSLSSNVEMSSFGQVINNFHFCLLTWFFGRINKKQIVYDSAQYKPYFSLKKKFKFIVFVDQIKLRSIKHPIKRNETFSYFQGWYKRQIHKQPCNKIRRLLKQNMS